MSARAVREELAELIGEAMASQGISQDALAARLRWPVERVRMIGAPDQIEALDFSDLLDLLDSVGLDPGEMTDWLGVRYRAERMKAKEERT